MDWHALSLNFSDYESGGRGFESSPARKRHFRTSPNGTFSGPVTVVPGLASATSGDLTGGAPRAGLVKQNRLAAAASKSPPQALRAVSAGGVRPVRSLEARAVQQRGDAAHRGTAIPRFGLRSRYPQVRFTVALNDHVLGRDAEILRQCERD